MKLYKLTSEVFQGIEHVVYLIAADWKDAASYKVPGRVLMNAGIAKIEQLSDEVTFTSEIVEIMKGSQEFFGVQTIPVEPSIVDKLLAVTSILLLCAAMSARFDDSVLRDAQNTQSRAMPVSYNF